MFFTPLLQLALLPPASPVQAAQHAQVIAGTSVTDVPRASSQAKELNLDLWLTFIALTTGTAIGAWAGRSIRR